MDISQKKRLLIIIHSILLISFTGELLAQDGHYWTHQYGTRSMLLGGSVIGGVEDLGAVYYNPSRLAQIDNPAFLISADVYEFNKIKIEDAFGNNLDDVKSSNGAVPSLAAGTFSVPFLKNHYFAWAILVRSKSNLGFSYRNEVYDDVLESYSGKEYFGGVFNINQDTKEEWAGFSWSYPVNEKLSVGLSSFFSTYTQSKGVKIDLQALTEGNHVAIYRYNKNFSLKQRAVLWKGGLSYKTKSLTIGLTLLSSSFPVNGEGSYVYENFASGVEDSTSVDDIYSTSYQNNLSVRYKTPWSAGLGATWNIKRSKIHISAEWFNNLPEYTLMKTSDHYSQSNQDTIGFVLTDKLNQVVNTGIGLEIYLSEKISFYCSFSTDFSAVTSDLSRFTDNRPETSNSIFNADLYHFGGGFVLSLKGADITLGGTFTGAKQDFTRPFNFPEKKGDSILDADETAKLKWNRWRVVFSFSLPFVKDVQRKVEEKLGF